MDVEEHTKTGKLIKKKFEMDHAEKLSYTTIITPSIEHIKK